MSSLEAERTDRSGASRGAAGSAPGLSFEVVDPGRLVTEADRAWLAARGLEAGRVLRVSGRVAVRLVDDGAMACAHERYAGVPGTTDVLTFDYREPGEAGPGWAKGSVELDADVMVCVDEARRQSESLGHDPRRELLLYVVHGMLHAAGADDADPAAAAAMHAREDEVLRAIGVGPVYARTGVADGTGAGGEP